MDFLTDWLTEWIKEMLVGGIMGNLENLFTSVNNQGQRGYAVLFTDRKKKSACFAATRFYSPGNAFHLLQLVVIVLAAPWWIVDDLIGGKAET